MKNPYIILDINENATDEEIEIARKRQLKLQCSMDENRKDENGEYLSNVINQAANDLLNKERRKEIDEKLNSKSKNLPAISTTSCQYPSQVILTSINNQLMKPENKLVIKRSFFDRKIKCKNLFIGVLNNDDCIYLVEDYDKDEDDYYLREYFTRKSVTVGFDISKCPWDKAKVFDVDGLLAFAYPAYQVLPNSIIRNGKVSDSILRSIYPILQEVLKNNIDELQQLFNKEQNKVNVRKK